MTLPAEAPAPLLPVPELLARHPGPALLLQGSDIREANAQAKALLRDASWWPAVTGWLAQPGQSQLTVKVNDRAALEASPLEEMVITWDRLNLPAQQWLLLGRDATLEHNLTLALADSRARYKALLDLSSDYVWETDRAGRFSFTSAKGLLGWSATEIAGKRPHELGLTAVDALTTPFLTQQPVHEAQLWLKDKQGNLRCLLTSAQPVFDTAGAWIGARGLCRDVTEQHDNAAHLATARTRERIVGHIVRIIRDGLSIEREFESAARALTHALSADGCAIFRRGDKGWELDASYGEAMPESTRSYCERCLQRGDTLQVSDETQEWLVCRTQHNRTANGAVMVWRSLRGQSWQTEELHLLEAVAEQIGLVWAQINVAEKLLERAERDGLTHLYNQRSFTEQVQQRLLSGHGGEGAVLVNIDLDNFKTINDHLGHHTGDTVLQQVGKAMEACIRGGDIAGRVGGDEFLLWLERTDSAGAEAVAQRLLAAIAAIADALPALPKRLSASIGIAPVHVGDTFKSLLQRADETMYKAKHSGKGHAEIAS